MTDAPQEIPDGGFTGLPFSFTGVTLRATGATTLRVRLVPDGVDAVRLDAYDDTGAPVLSVGRVLLRPISGARFAARATGPATDRQAWVVSRR